MGLTEHTVSLLASWGASAILPTRKRIAQWSAQRARQLTEEVMALPTAGQVQTYLKTHAQP